MLQDIEAQSSCYVDEMVFVLVRVSGIYEQVPGTCPICVVEVPEFIFVKRAAMLQPHE